ncbi:hypothetical protein F5Y08DRAFT_316022 [Xylaria arbuscula]|nr:hypothetical protein F5Y08DRAFT_316022 [Xylaria arbuscula]
MPRFAAHFSVICAWVPTVQILATLCHMIRYTDISQHLRFSFLLSLHATRTDRGNANIGRCSLGISPSPSGTRTD